MVRVEPILIVLIVTIITLGVKIKLNSATVKVVKSTKELDFYDTTIYEVDTKHLLDVIYTTYGIRDNGILKMKNIKYHSDSVESIVSKEGRYVNNMLYLTKDVIMKNDGYTYTTQKLNYNQKTQILNITSPFKATNNINTFWGKSLIYYSLKKEMYAKDTKSIFYTQNDTMAKKR